MIGRSLQSATQLICGRRLTQAEVVRSKIRCLRCRYVLDAIASSVCPECGMRIPSSAVDYATSKAWQAAWLGLVIPAFVELMAVVAIIGALPWIHKYYRSDAVVAIAALLVLVAVRFVIARFWRQLIARPANVQGVIVAVLGWISLPAELYGVSEAATWFGPLFSLY